MSQEQIKHELETAGQGGDDPAPISKDKDDPEKIAIKIFEVNEKLFEEGYAIVDSPDKADQEKLKHLMDHIRKQLDNSRNQSKIVEIRLKQEEVERITLIQLKMKENLIDIWDPKSCMERLKSLFQNIHDALYVLVVAILAISYPSAISMMLLFMSCALYTGMLSHQVQRYKINMIIMLVIIITLGVIMGFKKYLIDNMKHEFTDFVEFKQEIRINDLLGMSIDYIDFYHYNKYPGTF
jgi:hypothetical protein